MAGLFVKKGDTVIVRSGKDRGARGKVLLTSPSTERVLVEGVNRVKKHTKVQTTTRGAQEGGIVHQEARDPREQRAGRVPDVRRGVTHRSPQERRRPQRPDLPQVRRGPLGRGARIR